jgi:hypothetical protein
LLLRSDFERRVKRIVERASLSGDHPSGG